MKFDVSFTNKEITPWGGMVFLKQMLDKIGFKNQILSCEDLPQTQSNRGHKVSAILEAFITSIWCGANRFMHTEATRHGVVLCKIFNCDAIPAQDTYKRFFNKFDQATNQKVITIFIHGYLIILNFITLL